MKLREVIANSLEDSLFYRNLTPKGIEVSQEGYKKLVQEFEKEHDLKLTEFNKFLGYKLVINPSYEGVNFELFY